MLNFIHRIAYEKKSTPEEISLAWMLCIKPWKVHIPGMRKIERLQENVNMADILLFEEVKQIDCSLNTIHVSDVY